MATLKKESADRDKSSWVVLKFGGTSVATAAKWQEIVRQLKRVRSSQRKGWLVVSAVTKVTNLLNAAVEETLGSTSISKELINWADFTCSAYEKIANCCSQLAQGAHIL